MTLDKKIEEVFRQIQIEEAAERQYDYQRVKELKARWFELLSQKGKEQLNDKDA